MSARGMAPPPKHPLALGDKRDALERRRAELERWLWRLIGAAEVARSSQLKAFLEFDRALGRAAQQQQRRLEQLRLQGGGSTPPGPGLDPYAPSATPSEAGFGAASAYPGGGRAGSTADDSASDASGPSGAASASGGASSSRAAAAAMAAAGAWVAASGSGSAAEASPPPSGGTPGFAQSRLDPTPGPQPPGHGGYQLPANHSPDHRSPHPHITPGAGAAVATARASGVQPPGAAEAPLARLGIHLQSRADVRRLVDLLAQRLETACAAAAAAVDEAALLREANRAMAERLGELQVELQGGGAAAEARARLAEVEAARAAAERLAAQLSDTLASRGSAHAQQAAQLQAQLLEARAENLELLGRLQEWDVGGSSGAGVRVAEEAREQVAEAQREAEEAREQAAEARRQTEEAREQAAEARRQTEEAREQAAKVHLELQARSGEAEALHARLREQEQQLEQERKRRQDAEAAAAAPPPPPPPPPQQQQLERARADNALLAQEVKRLRVQAAQEREAHAAALAAHAQQRTELAEQVRVLQGQLVAGAREAQGRQEQGQGQDGALDEPGWRPGHGVGVKGAEAGGLGTGFAASAGGAGLTFANGGDSLI